PAASGNRRAAGHGGRNRVHAACSRAPPGRPAGRPGRHTAAAAPRVLGPPGRPLEPHLPAGPHLGAVRPAQSGRHAVPAGMADRAVPGHLGEPDRDLRLRLWRLQPTILTVAAVTFATGGIVVVQVIKGQQDADYLAEVPLIALMFLVMVWHGRRR